MAKPKKFHAGDLSLDYEVGFGKPPKETQFKKGQSGNPRGRPKGSLNLMTSFHRALRETVTVVEHGQKRRVNKVDAVVMQMVNHAVQGQIPHLRLLLPILQAIDSRLTTQEGKTAQDLTDPALLAPLLEQLTRGTDLILSAPPDAGPSPDPHTPSGTEAATPAKPASPEPDA